MMFDAPHSEALQDPDHDERIMLKDLQSNNLL
jgi:hypothetical protein